MFMERKLTYIASERTVALDQSFSYGGHWEENESRDQTRGFAGCIAPSVRIPFDEFFRAGFEDISGFRDAIYCSNVLEHFEKYTEIAS